MPRLLAAPARTAEGAGALGAGAMRAMSAGQPNPDSSDAAPAVTESEVELQRWPGWMPCIRSAARTSSILTWLGLPRDDGQAELDDLVGGRQEADAASTLNEPMPHTGAAAHAPTSAAVAAWRQSADFAASAARQLQTALLGFNPFPARAHFGSHTFLNPVSAKMRLVEAGGGMAPQSPEER